MKQYIVLFFLIANSIQFAQSSTPVSTNPSKESEVKTPAKVADSKPAEAKTIPKVETPAKKELPPLQKDGGFLVLGAVKWQADNITKKSFIIAKEGCEKDGLRLPTRDELIDAYFSKYPEFRNPGGYYLSGNRRASDRSHVWFVNFDNGHHNHGPLTREYNVRCVKIEPKAAPAKSESPTETKK